MIEHPTKVLVVTSKFPATGGSRIDRFVKFLPYFGFEPIVLSAAETQSLGTEGFNPPVYPHPIKTYYAASLGWSYFTERFLDRGPGAKHYQLLALLSFPERFIQVPDYMVRWIPRGIKLAREIVRREGIKVVLTSSPPESTHLIGMSLKRTYGLRWLADFRDLWTEKHLLYRPPTSIHDWWVKRLERKIFTSADHIIANTPDNAARHMQRFDLSPGGIDVIPNGFDPDDLIHQEARPVQGVFRIGYAGALDKHEFPWRVTLDALNRLAMEIGREKVKLVYCGYLSAQVKAYLQEQRMTDLVQAHGLVSHADAMRLTTDTEIRLLLLYETPYSGSIVPQKLYNYLIMNGPILAVAPEKGMTAAIIKATRMGSVISPTRGMNAIYEQLLSYYFAWQRGALLVAPDREEISRYDACNLTKRLSELLRGVA